MNPFKSLSLYVGVGMLLFGLFAGWSVRDWKADSDALSAVERGDRQSDMMREAIDNIAGKVENFKTATIVQGASRKDTIREIYKDVPVSADCAAPPSIVSLLSDARQRANAAASGELADPLPAGSPAPQPIN